MEPIHHFHDQELATVARIARLTGARMAAAPAFAATPNLGLGVTPNAAITSLTAPTGATVVWTAGTSGGRVDIIRVTQILSTSASGIINIFVLRSGVYYLFDIYAYATQSLTTNIENQPVDIYYNALVLIAADEICVANTVQSGAGPTAATHAVAVMGGNF